MPFTLTATGIESKPLAKLAELVAASAAFQAVTDSDDAAEALAHIHYPEADDTDDSTQTMPRAIIQPGPECTGELVDDNVCYQHSGSLVLVFQFDVPVNGDSENADGYWSTLMFTEAAWPTGVEATLAQRLLTFCNVIGAIIADLESKARQYPGSGGETYQNMVKYTRIAGPGVVSAETEQSAFFEAVYEVSWMG